MFRKHFVCLLLGISFFHCAHLDSKIENHYRKIEGKSAIHSGPNVDFIYMINLDQRPEKFERSLAQLSPYGIIPYRFSAVNGWKLSLKEIDDIGLVFTKGMTKGLKASRYLPENPFTPSNEKLGKVGRSYFCPGMTRGAIGILVSHLSILQDAYDSGYETIWVFEDDIDVVQDPRLVFERIEQLDLGLGAKNWDILFTDRDTKDSMGVPIIYHKYEPRPNFSPKNPAICNKRIQLNEHFTRIWGRYGAYSMVLRRSGIKKILDFIQTYGVFLPYDIEFCFPEGLTMICVNDDIVQHLIDGLSDNKKPDYRKK